MKSVFFLIILLTNTQSLLAQEGELRNIVTTFNRDNNISALTLSYSQKGKFKGTYLFGSKETERYMSGSTGKIITGLVINDLIHQNKIKLKDKVYPILRRFDWAKKIPFISEMTVEDLLHHRSGLGEYVSDGRFILEAQRLIRLHKLQFLPWEILERYSLNIGKHPGEAFAYSEDGYLLLGLMAELVLGGKLTDNMDNFYENSHYINDVTKKYLPLFGMKLTESSSKSDFKNLVTGFTGENHPWGFPKLVDASYYRKFPPHFEFTGGGFITHPVDLVKLIDGINSNPQLKKSILQKHQNEQSQAMYYGRGVFVYPNTPYGRMWGHTGVFPGYKTLAFHFDEADLTIAIAANNSEVDLQNLLKLVLPHLI